MNYVGATAAAAPADAATISRRTPTTLEKPSFLLNAPFSLSAGDANNVWMEEMDETKRTIDQRKAMKQFIDMYHFVAADALVYVLPTPADCRLQDLVYTANLGVVLEHLDGRHPVVLSNYESPPRVGETEVGLAFFRSMGYETHVAPAKFEGEADLKHLHENVYVGGYGMRSEYETFEWMEKTFDMQVVKLEKVDPYLYHLDCTIFPLTSESTLVCTEMYDKSELEELEKHTNVIDVSTDDCYSGICNSVRLFNTILNASHLHELRPGSEEHGLELAKNRRLEDIAVNLGFEVTFFNLSEYHKSGALLSCMMMHLNRYSYQFTLL